MATYDISALGSGLEFETTSSSGNSIIQIPGLNRIAVAWYQSATVTYVQCFNINPSTGAITSIGSPLDIETGSAAGTTLGISLVAIDASNLAVFRVSATTEGHCQLLSMDGTGNVTTNGAVLTFDGSGGAYPSTILLDSTHILATWAGADNDGYSCVFSVSTSGGVIAKLGTAFEFDTTEYTHGCLTKLTDTKAVVFYGGETQDGYARVLSINQSTFEVTAGGDAFEYLNSSTIIGNSTVVIDNSAITVINAWVDSTAGKQQVRSFSINTSTWAITAFGSVLDVTTSAGLTHTTSIQFLDYYHIICFYRNSTNGNTNVRVLTYNPVDGAISTTANTLEYYSNNQTNTFSTVISSTPGLFVSVLTDNDGDGRMYAVQTSLSKVSCDTASFIITANDNIFTKAKYLMAEVARFIVIGTETLLTKRIWSNTKKNNAIVTNQQKS